MLRRVWLILGWLWIVAVFYLSLRHQPIEPPLFEGVDKLHHAFAYALLMLWFSQLIVEHRARIRLLLALMLMGVGIEILQGMSGYRLFAWSDILANVIGALIGLGLAQTGMGRVLMILENNGKH